MGEKVILYGKAGASFARKLGAEIGEYEIPYLVCVPLKDGDFFKLHVKIKCNNCNYWNLLKCYSWSTSLADLNCKVCNKAIAYFARKYKKDDESVYIVSAERSIIKVKKFMQHRFDYF